MNISHLDLFDTNNNAIKLKGPITESTSIFGYGLSMVQESNNEIRNMLSGIYESTIDDMNVYHENFKNAFNAKFEFSTMVDKIFSMFKMILGKIYSKAKELFSKIVTKDKIITKYEDTIRRYRKPLNIQMDHYNYTYSGADISLTNLKTTFSDEYLELQGDIKNIFNSNNTDIEIDKALDKLRDNIQKDINIGGYYDKKRASVFCHSSGSISEDNYDIELSKTFRNGATMPSGLPITIQEIHHAISEYYDLDTILKKLASDKDDMIEACEKAKKDILKVSIGNIKLHYSISKDIEFDINKILKLKCGQLTECCNIYSIAYSSKVDAVKESLIQDKKIIFETISDIERSGGEL